MTGFRYLPVMISRTMLSLRKAADPRRGDWNIVEPAKNGPDLQTMRFHHRRVTSERGDFIALDVYSES